MGMWVLGGPQIIMALLDYWNKSLSTHVWSDTHVSKYVRTCGYTSVRTVGEDNRKEDSGTQIPSSYSRPSTSRKRGVISRVRDRGELP